MHDHSEYKAPLSRTREIRYEQDILSPVYPGGTPDSDDYDDNNLGNL